MNIIEDEIKEVLANNNTAQETLETLLENTNKQVSELIVNEPLYGDVDFDVLRKNGFAFVDDIVLPEGKVTSITNLPSRLKSLSVQGQLLKKIENLPNSITDLNVSFNYLTKIDLSNLKNLEKLNVANNKLTKLDGFPESLIEIDCNTNEIVKIDFDGLINLKKINISNNKINLVENLQEGVEEFNMDGNPSITFQNSVVPNMEDPEETDTDKIRLNDYENYLNKYFQLKKKYEDKLYDTKLQIFQKYSKKEAKKRIASIKPKCLKCKRPGGTIFKYDDYTHYAICGVDGSPCELNIEIQTGQLASVEELYVMYKEDTEKLKDSIIRHKLDALFNYVSEDASIELFKKELTSYNETSNILKEYLDQYNDIYNNEHKIEKLRKLEFEMKEKIQKFRSLLKEYQETNNTELLTLATEYQIKELSSLEKQIRDLKYVLVEMTESMSINYLVQKEAFPGNMDDISKYQQRVIKFNV
jgi:hypothetical protein